MLHKMNEIKMRTWDWLCAKWGYVTSTSGLGYIASSWEEWLPGVIMFIMTGILGLVAGYYKVKKEKSAEIEQIEKTKEQVLKTEEQGFKTMEAELKFKILAKQYEELHGVGITESSSLNENIEESKE